MTEKVDLKKSLDSYRATRGEFRLLDLPARRYLMIDGHGPEVMVGAAFEQAAAKKKRPPRLDDVRVEVLAEGRCVQTLHIGSFDDEARVLEQLHHEFIPAHGLRLAGTHHEIYLSDFRRVAPERQRTILRQPVAEA